MSRIDFHVHVTPPDISGNWQKYAGTEPYFALLSESPRNKFARAEDVTAALDASGFDRAVVFGFGFRDMGLCRYVNDYVIAAVIQHPDRLTGFISVPPASAGAEKEIDRCLSAGLSGIGEIFPDGQGFDIGNAEATARFAGVCGERKLPVLIHANEPVGHYYAGKTDTSLRQLALFIEHYPELTIILAHWGGGLLFYETMPELREQCRNVYYDTAATALLYDSRIYRVAVALGLTEKILFGSDFPLLPPFRYMAALAESGLTPEEQERILGGTAEQLLGRGSPGFSIA